MSQDKMAFEKFFPRPLVFADKAHELEMLSKWNDAKINWETALEAATAEANKLIAELKQDRNDLNYKCMERLHKIEELHASNQTLREALEDTTERLNEIEKDSTLIAGDIKCIARNKKLLEATPAESLQAHDGEVSQCKIDAERYQFVRKLNPREFAEIYDINIKTGVHFDHLISQALKEVK